jgi:hypothetical protein
MVNLPIFPREYIIPDHTYKTSWFSSRHKLLPFYEYPDHLATFQAQQNQSLMDIYVL